MAGKVPMAMMPNEVGGALLHSSWNARLPITGELIAERLCKPLQPATPAPQGDSPCPQAMRRRNVRCPGARNQRMGVSIADYQIVNAPAWSCVGEGSTRYFVLNATTVTVDRMRASTSMANSGPTRSSTITMKPIRSVAGLLV